MKRVYIKTFGCQMNEHDSERIAGLLRDQGFIRANSADEADLIVLNTCSIREKSEQKAFSELGRYVQLKQTRPNLRLALAGCVAQQEGAQSLKRFPGLDLVFGSSNIENIPAMIERHDRFQLPVLMTDEPVTPPKSTPAIRGDRIRAWVSIMEGCDRHCAFCVVPYTRGSERSRPSSDIVEEVRHLVANGYKEVTLLGQTVNSYGKSLNEGGDFAELLARLDAVPGLERIRFTSPHPCDMTPKAIDAMARLPKVCPHLHLPLQSASDRMLAAMARGYTFEAYCQIAARFRSAVPAGALTTDLIVGFPSETEADFEQTYQAVADLGFDHIYAFKYSRRPNTPAAVLADQIPEEVKDDRLRRLLELNRDASLNRNLKLVGTVTTLLIEGRSARNPTKLTGRTGSNKVAHVRGDDGLIGSLVHTRVTGATASYLDAELLEARV